MPLSSAKEVWITVRDYGYLQNWVNLSGAAELNSQPAVAPRV